MDKTVSSGTTTSYVRKYVKEGVITKPICMHSNECKFLTLHYSVQRKQIYK